jgi:hypothetical protein
MSLFPLYRELHPPTVVDCAAYGSVTAPRARNLVLGRSTYLEIYELVETEQVVPNPQAQDDDQYVNADGDQVRLHARAAVTERHLSQAVE